MKIDIYFQMIQNLKKKCFVFLSFQLNSVQKKERNETNTTNFVSTKNQKKKKKRRIELKNIARRL